MQHHGKTMGKNAYTQDYRVDYSDVEKNMCMKPAKVVDRFQSLAMAHSDDIGYDLKWFEKEDMGWILLYWHVKIDRLPEEGENLKISTWTRPYKRAQAQRDFDAVDEDGNQIIYAASRWVLMNTIKRRPAKMPDAFFDAYVFEDSRPLSDEDFKMPAPDPDDLAAERKILVTRRDTDTNGHANNLVYVEWAFDDVSDEIYENGTVTDIRVMYKKECRKGSTVTSHLFITELADEDDTPAEGHSAGKRRIRTDSVFFDPENPKKPYAQVSTIWEL